MDVTKPISTRTRRQFDLFCIAELKRRKNHKGNNTAGSSQCSGGGKSEDSVVVLDFDVNNLNVEYKGKGREIFFESVSDEGVCLLRKGGVRSYFGREREEKESCFDLDDDNLRRDYGFQRKSSGKGKEKIMKADAVKVKGGGREGGFIDRKSSSRFYDREGEEEEERYFGSFELRRDSDLQKKKLELENIEIIDIDDSIINDADDNEVKSGDRERGFVNRKSSSRSCFHGKGAEEGETQFSSVDLRRDNGLQRNTLEQGKIEIIDIDDCNMNDGDDDNKVKGSGGEGGFINSKSSLKSYFDGKGEEERERYFNSADLRRDSGLRRKMSDHGKNVIIDIDDCNVGDDNDDDDKDGDNDDDNGGTDASNSNDDGDDNSDGCDDTANDDADASNSNGNGDDSSHGCDDTENDDDDYADADSDNGGSDHVAEYDAGLQLLRPTAGTSPTLIYTHRTYRGSKMYNQFEYDIKTGSGYGSNGYDSGNNGRDLLDVDSKYKPKETKRRLSGGLRNQKMVSPITSAIKVQNISSNVNNENKDNTCADPVWKQYNGEKFPVNYTDAKFFIIKPYSEKNVHKSIKYSVWASSTPQGNKKLDVGYQEAKEMSGNCPVFLFFSVNNSGQFVGLAEMVGPVKNGIFRVKWDIIKDIPNSLLKHITLENNVNKPVTESRDTQEVTFKNGLQMLKIFKDHSCKTSILNDHEGRQK